MENINSTDAENELITAIEHHKRGELTQAELGYVQVLKAVPQHPDALHLLGVIAHQMGNAELGIQRVNESLSVESVQPVALNNLGNMLAGEQRLEEAIDCYRRAIAIKPDYAQAFHNLGNVLGDNKQGMEAVECYRRALELQPDSTDSLMAMGIVLEKIGQFEEAVSAFRTVISLSPDSTAARERLGTVLRKMHRLSEAAIVYDELLQLRPGDPVAGHFREVCEPARTSDRATAGYVRAVFDGFAEEFEACLAELNYRVPELFATVLRQHLDESDCDKLDVADLGCGTGLMAKHLRHLAQRLVGVDLSSAMLTQAGKKNAYDELLEADLNDFLSGCSEEFDLLVSADTFNYLGDLRPTLSASCGALRPGGHLLFSVEKLDGEDQAAGYQLSWTGRYVHSSADVRRLVEEVGLQVLDMLEAQLREEGSEPTVGVVVMAKKVSGTVLVE